VTEKEMKDIIREQIAYWKAAGFDAVDAYKALEGYADVNPRCSWIAVSRRMVQWYESRTQAQAEANRIAAQGIGSVWGSRENENNG